ncbi:pentapeptide repeat-containing protein [uncultured Holdemanella sp.]|uniref:pentapeptide repeat-containing protein n=1 Tax=uncultured Holdemanella sp. TaxID=1763549 RepID=UPI0025EB6DE9|nr:pentapeptide repeat-containing protein [uncultured Holdemanella sp.]
MKKLKINACLEPMDEWTYETYVSDYLFENVSIEESLDNITIDGCKFSKCQFKDCSFSFIECMDLIFDHCEFENVHFNQCSLSRVHFISCRISGVEISQSLNQDVLIQLCKGHYCDFGGSTFKDCLFDTNDFTGSGFIQCDFKQSSFCKCVLNLTEWFNTELKKLDFSSCGIENIAVSSDKLTGVVVNSSQALEFVKLLGIVVKD